MGNWRHRIPRRSNRPREHWAAYSNHANIPPELLKDNVPEWEKKFCYMVGSVPWRKLLVTKTIMLWHTNVLEWKDSAVEETFQNAKKRFWSEMNGLDCEIPLPDPDIYIDQIDWNPDIDSELVDELDREHSNPSGGGEQNDGFERQIKKARNGDSAISDGSNTNQGDDVNRWEGNNVNGVSESKENRWGERKDPTPMLLKDGGGWGCGDWGEREDPTPTLLKGGGGWGYGDWGEREDPTPTLLKDGGGWGCGDWNNPWIPSFTQQHDRAAVDGGWGDRGGENRCGGRQWLPYNNDKRVAFRGSNERSNSRRPPYGFSGRGNGRFQADESRWATRVKDRKRVSFE